MSHASENHNIDPEISRNVCDATLHSLEWTDAKHPHVGAETRFDDLGVDSLIRADILTILSSRYPQITEDDVSEAATPLDIAIAIQNRIQQPRGFSQRVNTP